jgi:hypothetical protein
MQALVVEYLNPVDPERKMTYAYRHAEFISAPHGTGGRFA